MSTRLRMLLVLVLGAALVAPLGCRRTAPEDLELWVFLRTELSTAEGVADAHGIIVRAADAGFTGVVIDDFRHGQLHHEGSGSPLDAGPAEMLPPVVSAAYRDALSALDAAARTRGFDVVVTGFPFGWSEALLSGDPNLAEGLAVRGAAFVVAPGGRALTPLPDGIGLRNGGFEDADGPRASDWDQDRPGGRTRVVDGAGRDGSRALVITGGEGNGRAMQGIEVPARRQIRVSFWTRSEGFEPARFDALLLDDDGVFYSWADIRVASDAGWTEHTFTANTRAATSLRLYLGAWGPSDGRVWIDDVSITAAPLVNVIRRDGAPLTLRRGETVLDEGADFSAVEDPLLGRYGWMGRFGDAHAGPVVTLPATTRLRPGDEVTADYFAVQPLHKGQVSACMTGAAVDAWSVQHAAALAGQYPRARGVLLSHDEIRHLYACDRCRAAAASAGALVADHTARSSAIVREEAPSWQTWFWSDMYDPHHNAIAPPWYTVESSVAGAWEGLPAEATILNWNRDRTTRSMRHFRRLGLRQIVAGFYDEGDAATIGRADRRRATRGGAVGAMYTTWTRDYAGLEAWAAEVRGAARTPD